MCGGKIVDKRYEKTALGNEMVFCGFARTEPEEQMNICTKSVNERIAEGSNSQFNKKKKKAKSQTSRIFYYSLYLNPPSYIFSQTLPRLYAFPSNRISTNCDATGGRLTPTRPAEIEMTVKPLGDGEPVRPELRLHLHMRQQFLLRIQDDDQRIDPRVDMQRISFHILQRPHRRRAPRWRRRSNPRLSCCCRCCRGRTKHRINAHGGEIRPWDGHQALFATTEQAIDELQRKVSLLLGQVGLDLQRRSAGIGQLQDELEGGEVGETVWVAGGELGEFGGDGGGFGGDGEAGEVVGQGGDGGGGGGAMGMVHGGIVVAEDWVPFGPFLHEHVVVSTYHLILFSFLCRCRSTVF